MHLHVGNMQQMQDIAYFTTNPMIMHRKVNAISWEFSLHDPTACMLSYQYKSNVALIHGPTTKKFMFLEPLLKHSVQLF
jgi:hypothetical protein